MFSPDNQMVIAGTSVKKGEVGVLFLGYGAMRYQAVLATRTGTGARMSFITVLPQIISSKFCQHVLPDYYTNFLLHFQFASKCRLSLT